MSKLKSISYQDVIAIMAKKSNKTIKEIQIEFDKVKAIDVMELNVNEYIQNYNKDSKRKLPISMIKKVN